MDCHAVPSYIEIYEFLGHQEVMLKPVCKIPTGTNKKATS